jgi:hypothetical protein
MKRLRVVPIVEGHGEYESVRPLLERIWLEVALGEYIDVLRPIRHGRQRLAREAELRRAVQLAASKLANAGEKDMPGLILVLVDADDDPPCLLGPQLLNWAKQAHPDGDVACVVANVEYETWFVAAAESLSKYLDLRPDTAVPDNPERQRAGKGWIERRFRGPKYSETQDQPALTAAMDLSLCRRRSASFDKLCREFESRRREGSDED